MADYGFNTNLGPQAQQPTSLGDMINLARGVQSYQQAEQINPLQVRQQQAATNKAEFDLHKSYAEKERGVLGGLANDPDFINGNQKGIIEKLKMTKSFLRGIGVPEHPEDTSDQLMKIASQDPKNVLPYIKNMIQGEIGATGQQGLQTPQLATVSGAPATFTSGTGVAKPLAFGSQGSTGLAQSVNGQPPAVGTSPTEKPTGVTQTQMTLPYPVRRAGDIRPFAPNEQQDQEIGLKYRSSLADASSKMSTSLRNIDEVIKEAEKVGSEEWNKGAGIVGTLGRNISTFLGTEQGVRYKRLSKDLANLQISMGADTSTDQGKTLLAAANGDITLPPDILQDIAHRTRADRENTMMQSQGAQIFAQKYGDANLKKFQKDWADNAKDSRVFEAISIYNSDLPQKQKIDRINELFKGVSKEGMEKIRRQKANLERLSTTGEL